MPYFYTSEHQLKCAIEEMVQRTIYIDEEEMNSIDFSEDSTVVRPRVMLDGEVRFFNDLTDEDITKVAVACDDAKKIKETVRDTGLIGVHLGVVNLHGSMYVFTMQCKEVFF